MAAMDLDDDFLVHAYGDWAWLGVMLLATTRAQVQR
jgi:hypothetical protein